MELNGSVKNRELEKIHYLNKSMKKLIFFRKFTIMNRELIRIISGHLINYSNGKYLVNFRMVRHLDIGNIF